MSRKMTAAIQGIAMSRIGGGVYLFTHQPVDLAGVEGKTEVYAVYGDVSHRDGPWEFHLQARWRDTKLRSFYPSTTWVQEAWAALALPMGPVPGEAEGGAREGAPEFAGEHARAERGSLTLRAGKLYQRIGRFWDGSFIGNVHYFDGLKLDPEFGAEALLRWPAGGGRVELYAQYLADGDRIKGALAGRDLEGLDGGSEGGGFAGGLGYRSPPFSVGGRPLRASAGVSGLWERADYGPTSETIHQPGGTVDLTDRIHVLLEYDDWTPDPRRS